MDSNQIKKMDIKSLFELALRLYQLPEEQNEAKKVFRQITEIQIDYDNVNKLYYKGMSHYYSGWETTKAIQCFKKILKIGTADTEFLFNIGIYLYKNGYPSRALDCFDKVLNISNDIDELYNFELDLKNLGDRSMIYKYLDKIFNLKDHNIDQKYCKAISAYCLYKDQLAINYFKEVAKEENQNIIILLDTVNKLRILKQPIEAYKCLQKILHLGDNNIAILSESIKLLNILNKSNEAEEWVKKILDLQTDDLINLYDLAEFLNSNGILYATKLYKKIPSIVKPQYSTEEKYIRVVCRYY